MVNNYDAGCASTSTFDVSKVKNADSYQLDIKTMNCTDTHTLELKQGDTLKIQFCAWRSQATAISHSTSERTEEPVHIRCVAIFSPPT